MTYHLIRISLLCHRCNNKMKPLRFAPIASAAASVIWVPAPKKINEEVQALFPRKHGYCAGTAMLFGRITHIMISEQFPEL